MLKLYGGARTRANIVHWYLNELDVPHELVTVNLLSGENLTPEFLAINPMGKVPAIEDGDFKLWESGAILLYLADRHGKLGDTPEQRAEMMQWVIFSNATLTPLLFDQTQREQFMPRLMGPLNDTLGTQPFLTGQDLTVADVAVGASLLFLQLLMQVDFGAYPAVMAYLDRLTKRPAFQKVAATMS